MSMLRLNRPSILVYGGTIAPGCHNGKKLDVVSAFEAWGERVAGKIDENDFSNIIKNACPGAVHVVVCTPLILCLLQLKLWGWLFIQFI